jgi:hypothetical protein
VLIGHYAPALVLQRARPGLRLWWLFLATQFVDVLWGLFVLGGLEHVRVVPGFTASNALDLWDMPYSHSLGATLAWGLVAFAAWRSLSRGPGRTLDALVVALAVVSHFALDLLVHVHDLPVLAAQGPKLGLGLWQFRGPALGAEMGLFALAAVWWWWPRRADPGALRAGAGLLVLTGLGVLSFYLPPPATPAATALSCLLTYAVTAGLAAWMARRAPAALAAAEAA